MESIGIDIGSQGAKLMLLDPSGSITAESFAPYPILYPKPSWAEQDPRQWEDAVIQGLKDLVAQSVNPAEILAIGIDAQVDGAVPVDSFGRPLCNCIIWMDHRATQEEGYIDQVIGREAIFRITGCNLDASHVLPKLLWLKNNLSGFSRAFKILTPASYLLYWLTGEFGVDYSNASSTLLMDIRKKEWSSEFLKELGIAGTLLPPLFPSTHRIGRLRREIAHHVGLPSAPMVAVGCGDEHAACVGVGAFEEDVVFDITGTAEGTGVSTAKPLVDESRLLEIHGHALPDLWLLENPGFVSGGNLRWFQDAFCVTGGTKITYDDLTKEAASIPRGSEGIIFLPTLMGAVVPEWNSLARGNLFGFTLNCTRAHVVRAIMETTAYGIRDIIDAMKKMGLRITKIRVAGGGSKSTLWNQIKSDVVNLPLETVQTSETASFGSALIGMVTVGVFPDLKAAMQETVRLKEIIYPSDEREVYDDAYRLYREVYFSLKPVFSRQK